MCRASHGAATSGSLLELEQQRGVLDFDDSVDVLESSLHDSQLALHSVVSVSDLLSNNFFA